MSIPMDASSDSNATFSLSPYFCNAATHCLSEKPNADSFCARYSRASDSARVGINYISFERKGKEKPNQNKAKNKTKQNKKGGQKTKTKQNVSLPQSMNRPNKQADLGHGGPPKYPWTLAAAVPGGLPQARAAAANLYVNMQRASRTKEKEINK